jgi:hypothetical protein
MFNTKHETINKNKLMYCTDFSQARVIVRKSGRNLSIDGLSAIA